MLKTFKLYQQFIVDVPFFVSYDTETGLSHYDIAIALNNEPEEHRFEDEAVEPAIAAIKSVKSVESVETYRFDFCDEELEYDPSAPMWTSYMPEGYEEQLMRDGLECDIRRSISNALYDKNYEEASRLLEQLRAL